MEWLAIVAGVVSGVLSGLGAAWIGRPAAAAAAEEVKERNAARRELVDMGRALVTEAYAENWSRDSVARDSRFLALRRHLSSDVKSGYNINHTATTAMVNVPPGSKVNHELLRSDIERLDREWDLS